MPSIKSLFLALASVLISVAPLHAADETCAACDRKVLIAGEFRHTTARSEIVFAGATPRQSAPFREEIYGKNFSVSVPNLEPGKYTVVLGFAGKPGSPTPASVCST